MNKCDRHFMYHPVLLILFLLFTSVLNASEVKHLSDKVTNAKAAGPVKGKVTDSRKAPLDGVSVSVKGSKKATTTDAQGVFKFDNLQENAVLVFSFTGFTSKEYSLSKGMMNIEISLTEQPSVLTDVVVVGYGTQTKKDLTGAVVQVKAAAFRKPKPKICTRFITRKCSRIGCWI